VSVVVGELKSLEVKKVVEEIKKRFGVL